MKELKATLKVQKNSKGYVVLSLDVGDLKDVKIMLDDFNGTQKSTVRKLYYRLDKLGQ